MTDSTTQVKVVHGGSAWALVGHAAATTRAQARGRAKGSTTTGLCEQHARMPWRQYEVIAHDDFVDMEVTLLGIEPRIWRRLHVPAVSTLALLGVVEGDSPSLRCVGGERSGPPEDSGGIGGYMDLCAILADRRHPEYAQMRTWVGKGFDPEKIDLVAINRHLAALAKRAARPAGPAKKPRRAHASAR